jgi:proteic killer suppression protein
MIKTFADKATAAIFAGIAVLRLPGDIQPRARTKLMLLHGPTVLDDLRVPPSNHLEALQRERAGQHSIRINQQWRLCFVWHEGDAYDVEITDYH